MAPDLCSLSQPVQSLLDQFGHILTNLVWPALCLPTLGLAYSKETILQIFTHVK